MVQQETEVIPISPKESPKESESQSNDLSSSSSSSPPSPNKIKLSDGRFLAYTERGVPKNLAKYKIIIVHGFGSSKEMKFLAPQVYINSSQLLFLSISPDAENSTSPAVRARTTEKS